MTTTTDHFSNLRRSVRSFEGLSENITAYVKSLADTPDDFTLHFDEQLKLSMIGNYRVSPINAAINTNPSEPGERFPGVRVLIELSAAPGVELTQILSPALGLNLRQLPSNEEGGLNRYSATLFAEDWPFLGALVLYHFVQDQRVPGSSGASAEILQSVERTVQIGFPSLQFDWFTMVAAQGILPLQREAFLEFVLPYSDPNYTPQLETLPLPSLQTNN